jgi:hypothetical protein
MNPKISQRLFENTMSYLRLACFPSDAELAPRGCSDPLDMNGFSQAMLFVMLTAKVKLSTDQRRANGRRKAGFEDQGRVPQRVVGRGLSYPSVSIV